MLKLTQQNSAHWYTRDGAPCYEVPYADPKREGMRKPTLRDAKKLNLAPSVTTVLGIIRKEGIRRWEIENAMMEALTNKRIAGEVDEDYVKRLARGFIETTTNAASWGTACHNAVEDWLTKQIWTAEKDGFRTDIALDNYQKAAKELNITVRKNMVERSFACDMGYGGKIDIVGIYGVKRAVIDLKFKETKSGKEIEVYGDDYGQQLAAYDYGIHGQDPPESLLLNLIISVSEKGRYKLVDWTKDAGKLLNKFIALLNYWKIANDYYPGG